jgi:glucokinase
MTPEAFIEVVGAVLAEWGVERGDVDGIGVSVAAVVGAGGHIVRAENLRWWDVPFGDRLREAFDRPVIVETDVYCGAHFEATSGHARTSGSALYVSVGTGVGHAFILEGRVWRGAVGGANALGHMVLRPDGAPCYCGHRGCLCTTASGLAQAVDQPPDRALADLAQAIAAALTLLEPEIVILTGGALSQPWFDLDQLTRLLPDLTYPGIVQPPLVISDVPDPNLRGAALLLKEIA